MNKLKSFLVLMVAAFVLACSGPPDHHGPPSEDTSTVSQKLDGYQPTANGSAAFYSVVGPITGQTIQFGLWLPPGYADGTGPYPVMYVFHGKNSSHTITVNIVLPFIKTAITQGQLRPTIVVFPYAGATSWYTNNCSGSWPIETMIIDELIPHIDANTLSYGDADADLDGDADYRLITGFSMGGFGALKYAGKYPEKFAAVTAHAAPRLDPAITGMQNEVGFQDVFCGDLGIYALHTPTYLYDTNRVNILGHGLVTRVTAGGSDGTRFSVIAFKDKLTTFGIPYSYTLFPGINHVMRDYFLSDDEVSLEMMDDAMP